MSESLVFLWGTFLENFWYLIVFCYGAVVGSFLNVLIYRMPLGMSVSKPPSHCPNCNTLLRFWDNIPLIAFLSLGGR
ncbi:MAG: prepilin peptidase, partial [Armatimonadota bacterium]